MYAHQILGIDADASAAEVTAAYRRRVLNAHPDRGGRTEEFIAIRKAYETLIRRAGRGGDGSDFATAHDSRRTAYTAGTRPTYSRRTYARPEPTPEPATASSQDAADWSETPTSAAVRQAIWAEFRRRHLPGLLSAFGFTCFCALVITLNAIGPNPSFMNTLGIYGGSMLMLAIPGSLAAFAGAQTLREARGIYHGIVLAISVACFFNCLGAVGKAFVGS